MVAALEVCTQVNHEWLRLKASELAAEDVTSSSACMAEILAYGAMLKSSLNVEPVPTAKNTRTADYLVNVGGEQVIVEVHAKQYSNTTVDKLNAFHKETRDAVMRAGPGVGVYSHWVVPFGEPKLGESVTENVISRVAQTKQDEGQADESKPSVLWLDFQDPTWSLVIEPTQAIPLQYWRESFWSGPFWYAFYGYPGLPIFEDHYLGMLGKQVRMRHYGKFRQGSKFSACLVATRRGLYLLENPWAINVLPDLFIEHVFQMEGFNFVCSWLNWPDGRLRQRVKNEYIRLAALEAYGRGKQ